MDASDVIPGRVYTPREVAEVLRLSPSAIRDRVQAGTLVALPRVGNQPIRVLGSEVLRVLGLPTVQPKPPRGETMAERIARGKAAGARMKSRA